METIILKTVLCSGLLLALYHLFLAKEKTLIFNRFYLIVALLFSLGIPFLNIKTKPTQKDTIPAVLMEEAVQTLPGAINPEPDFEILPIVYIVYLSVAVFFLGRVILSILKIRRLKGRTVVYHNRNIVLLKEDLAPFSFWNTIYLSENYFKNSKIDNAIFLHEEIHIKQKHSIDILVIEAVKAIFWFNPFVYFYKKAIINNHEFIADESVILHSKNVKHYQELILQEVLKQQNLPLIHQFNFNNTKKRFIMMTSKNSKFASIKKYLSIPAFAVLAIVFAEKTYAKVSEENQNSHKDKEELSEPFRKHSKEQKIVKSEKSVKILKDTTTSTLEVKLSNGTTVDTPSDKSVPPPPPPSSDFIQAEFPGGANTLRTLIMNNFDASVFDGNEGNMKAVTYISINEKGKVESVTATGENEKFNIENRKAVKLALAETVWKPATEKGQPIKTVVFMPITMHFAPPAKTQ